MLAVRFPEDIENRLADLASQTGSTKTFNVNEAFLAHLNDMKDRYLALSRLENAGKWIALDEMKQGSDVEG